MQSTVKRVVGLALFLLLLAAAYYAASRLQPRPATQSPRRSMFGVELSPEAASLASKVERSYQAGVREVRTSGHKAGQRARGVVARDGTPVIEISKYTQPTEAVIVHELIHLEMYEDGYPDLNFVRRDRRFMKGEDDYLNFIISGVHDQIHHFMFYPRMRQMGLDPEAVVRADAEAVLRAQDYDYMGLPADDVRAINYFKIWMNVSDPGLRRRLTDLYLKKEWRGPWLKASRMIEAVESSGPKTREQELAALEKCLNLLGRDGFRFSFRRWWYEMRGRHKHWYAEFEITA